MARGVLNRVTHPMLPAMMMRAIICTAPADRRRSSFRGDSRVDPSKIAYASHWLGRSAASSVIDSRSGWR